MGGAAFPGLSQGAAWEPAQWLQGSKEHPQRKAGGGFGTAKPVAGGPQGTVALARRKDLGWDPMACDDPLSPR